MAANWRSTELVLRSSRLIESLLANRDFDGAFVIANGAADKGHASVRHKDLNSGFCAWCWDGGAL